MERVRRFGKVIYILMLQCTIIQRGSSIPTDWMKIVGLAMVGGPTSALVIGKKYIYAELQKTGSDTIQRHLLESYGGRPVTSENATRYSSGETLGKEPRAKHGGLSKWNTGNASVVMGSVRNPFAWYVSLYNFGNTGDGGMSRHIRSHSSFTSWLHCIMAITACAHNHSVVDFGRRHGIGLMTTRYLLMYEGYGEAIRLASSISKSKPDGAMACFKPRFVTHWIRTEELEDDLCAAVRAAGFHACSPIYSQTFFKHQRPHPHWSTYYTGDTLDLIRLRDRFIFQHHGYSDTDGTMNVTNCNL